MLQSGIYIWFDYPAENADIGGRFRLIKNAGFDSIMIWWGDNNGGADFKKADYVRLSEKVGLPIINAHLPFDSANDLWLDSAGDDYADFVCRQIKECSDSHIPAAVMHLTGKNPPPYSKSGLERVKRIADAAEKYNVNLALENLRRVEYLDAVFQNIKSEKMGFCFDSGHNNFFTPERDMLGDYKGQLTALHLNDNTGDADLHMLPFDGTANWERTINTLKEINYKGVLSLEVQSNRHMKYEQLSEEEFLTLAFERVTRIRKRLEQ